MTGYQPIRDPYFLYQMTETVRVYHMESGEGGDNAFELCMKNLRDVPGREDESDPYMVICIVMVY